MFSFIVNIFYFSLSMKKVIESCIVLINVKKNDIVFDLTEK